MDVEIAPVHVGESLPINKEPHTSKGNPKRDEEDDIFYDAGEEIAENPLDVTPPNSTYHVASESLNNSDNHEQIPAILKPQSGEEEELHLDCTDDLSTIAACSDSDNDFSDNEESFSGCNGSSAYNNDETIIETNNEVKSAAENVHLQENNSRSSMEVMDDDSDDNYSKSGSSTEFAATFTNYSNHDVNDCKNWVSENAAHKNVNICAVAGGSDNVSPCVPEIATENDVNVRKSADVDDILTMDDDSDVDESLQENLDVALKVVEENAMLSPPVNSSAGETNYDAKTNKAENTQKVTESILQELHDDAAQINDGITETIEDRFCPCQVVLFKIDFDKYIQNRETSTEVSATNETELRSDSDTFSSRSVRTPNKTRPAKSRPVARRKRKIASSSDRRKNSSRSVAESCGPTSSSYEISPSDRSRRTVRQAVYLNCYGDSSSNSSSSESEDLPLSRSSKTKNRKIAQKSPGNIAEKVDSEKPSLKRRAALREKNETKNRKNLYLDRSSSESEDLSLDRLNTTKKRKIGKRSPEKSAKITDCQESSLSRRATLREKAKTKSTKDSSSNISSSESEDLPLSRSSRMKKCRIVKPLPVKNGKNADCKEPSLRSGALREKNETMTLNVQKLPIQDANRSKTLIGVSLPIITSVLKSLRENSYREFGDLMDEKKNEYQSNSSVKSERLSRRRKLSNSDTSKSNTDDDYQPSSKLWKSDDGGDTVAQSVRRKLKVDSAEKSLRKRSKSKSYTENSGSDVNDEEEILPKKNQKKKRILGRT